MGATIVGHDRYRELPAALGTGGKTAFWRLVERRAVELCWRWRGPHSGPTGRFTFGGRVYVASRVAYVLSVGALAKDNLAKHLECSTPDCCNPYHMGLPVKGLTPSRVVMARADYAAGTASVRALAERYNVSPVAMVSALAGKGRWKHEALQHAPVQLANGRRREHMYQVVSCEVYSPTSCLAKLSCGHTRLCALTRGEMTGRTVLCPTCRQASA